MNLRVVEKEDLPLLKKWLNNHESSGEYIPFRQESSAELEKRFESSTLDKKFFVVEKKDGSKIGLVGHFPAGEKLLEIGFMLVPDERGKGYCTEAARILVDYLFLSREIVRIQACTDVRNVGSQRVLEKVGFKKEGTLRKSFFNRGEWRDTLVYSILREEWKEPKLRSQK